MQTGGVRLRHLKPQFTTDLQGDIACFASKSSMVSRFAGVFTPEVLSRKGPFDSSMLLSETIPYGTVETHEEKGNQ